MNDQEVRRGAGIYSKPVLGFYDLLVVKFSNSLAWRCPSQLMLDQYNRCIGTRHLDVGPGTGWYLANADLPETAEITLMDLNENSVEHAASRLAHTHVSTRGVTANVLEPIPEALGQFDSIAANFVFHCVPGSWADKGVAFKHLGERLAADGVLFGSTILGSGVSHNLIGRGFMALYNRLGIFHNREDDAAGLEAALQRSFDQVKVDVIGTVAVFSARNPLRNGGAGGLD